MQTFDTQQTERFGQLLTQREAELRTILRAHGSSADAAGASPAREVVDFKDMAGEETLATIDEVTADHASAELEQVRLAQARLRDHSYGYCLDCGEAIDLRRLAALPATGFCTACQTVHEHERGSGLRR